MKQLTLLILGILSLFNIKAQKSEESVFLAENKEVINLQKINFAFSENFYSNQLFFFGFVHGSQTPQLLDFELLKKLHQSGVHNYAPEIDYSLAYFFNSYINSGDEKILDYACANYSRVPQDASIQFKEKWQKIYTYNKTLPKENSINVLGFDYSLSAELILTHLAFLSPEEQTDITLIDSLRHFKNLETKDVKIISGKPVWKSGKSWDYFFGTDKSRYFNKFVESYKSDSIRILEAFGENADAVRHLMNQNEELNREETIFNNFLSLGLPLVNKGDKIYANYGFSHVLQEKINGFPYLAKRIKDSCEIAQVTILGLLAQSECLDRSKFKRTGPRVIKGVKFKGAEYNGYKTSKTLDADSYFEQVEGRKLLIRATKGNNVVLFKLEGDNSPFNNSTAFINMKRGGRKWKLEENSATTDYVQYIFFIKNSKANVPLEAAKIN